MIRQLGQRGQSVVEAILLLVVFLVISTLVSRGFRQNELFSQMVSGPWLKISGMLQNGVWASPAKSMKLHPSNHERHVSWEPENRQ